MNIPPTPAAPTQVNAVPAADSWNAADTAKVASLAGGAAAYGAGKYLGPVATGLSYAGPGQMAADAAKTVVKDVAGSKLPGAPTGALAKLGALGALASTAIEGYATPTEQYRQRFGKRYGIEGVKDKTGVVVQDEVDAAALLGQAAGFSPSGVRNAYEGKSAIVGHDHAIQARRSALVERFAMAAMANDEEGKTDAREAIQRFNEKNPGRRILPMQLAQSVRQRQKRIREAEDGVWLPRKRRDVVDVGRFSTGG